MFLSLIKKKKRWGATLKTDTVTFEGVDYQLRELTTSEVDAFLFRLKEQGEEGASIACAWMLTRSCAQFKDDKPEELLVYIGRHCMEYLVEKSLELSRIGETYFQEDLKKSESIPNAHSDAN